MDKNDEIYVCDICREPMLTPDSKISFTRTRYFLSKEEPMTSKVTTYDLCKNCYDALNGCIRDMKIKAKKKPVRE